MQDVEIESFSYAFLKERNVNMAVDMQAMFVVTDTKM